MQQCKIFFSSFIRHERYFSFILGIFFFRQVFPRKNFFPSKSVCRTSLYWNHPYPFSPQKSNGRLFTWNSLGRIRELARCKLLTLVQKLCAENCAENCPHIYVTMHQLSRQCCGPKSRRCKSSCVASLTVVLLILVYRYRVSIQPSTGLLIAVPDEAIDRLKDHLSPLNKWSLAGQCHVISLLFFTFQRFGLSVWGLIICIGRSEISAAVQLTVVENFLKEVKILRRIIPLFSLHSEFQNYFCTIVRATLIRRPFFHSIVTGLFQETNVVSGLSGIWQ